MLVLATRLPCVETLALPTALILVESLPLTLALSRRLRKMAKRSESLALAEALVLALSDW